MDPQPPLKDHNVGEAIEAGHTESLKKRKAHQWQRRTSKRAVARLLTSGEANSATLTTTPSVKVERMCMCVCVCLISCFCSNFGSNLALF